METELSESLTVLQLTLKIFLINKLSPLCFRVNKVKKHFCYSFQDENNTPVAIKDAQIPDISGALSHAYGNMAKLDEKKSYIFVFKVSHL